MSCRPVGCLYSFMVFTDFSLQKSSMYNGGVVLKHLYKVGRGNTNFCAHPALHNSYSNPLSWGIKRTDGRKNLRF